MSTTYWWRDAEKKTEDVIRLHSRTFTAATQLLPTSQKHAIRALYAFCRSSDDLVDRQGASLADVSAWRSQVALPANQQTDPVLICWARTREQYNVDHLYEQELLDGVEMDIGFQPYPDWTALERYCYLVASTVGLMSMPIIGLADGATFEQARPYAVKLGVALQLTNILRDVGEDLDRGRVYLPIEDLRRFDLSLTDIKNRVFDRRFISLMQFEIERARCLFEQALPGIGLLARSARPAVGAAALFYRAILDEIEKIGYQVYTRRAYTSTWKKISMLPEIVFYKWPALPINF